MSKALMATVVLFWHAQALAQGMSSEELQQTLGSIRRSQKQSQALLNQFGFQGYSATDPAGGNATNPAAAGASLFRVHGELKSMRAALGTVLFGTLVNRLVISGEGSPAIVLLDAGQREFSQLKAIGIAKPASNPERISIEIQSLVFRSGKTLSIAGQALDEEGAYGIEAQVVSQKALAVAGAMAGGFISGLASAQQTQNQTAFGFSQVQPTGRNAILQGVAQTAADQSKRLIEESTREKPILIVEPGARVNVFLKEEVRF